MDVTSTRWREVAPSEYPREREALAFVRDGLPDHEPYRAWSNFEFLADDGSIYEVDLLVLTPKGFFLVEIKSHLGVVTGDQGIWSWRHEGSVDTIDNPLLLANRKAKKLITLLRRQPALRKVHSPFLEALVFLSHGKFDSRFAESLRTRVHLRDRPAGAGQAERPGILAALSRWSPDAPPRRRLDRPVAKAVSRAMEEVGIRPSQRARRVGDYELDERLPEGAGFQDWAARHASLGSERARIRIYGVPTAASPEERKTRRSAARREYQVLRGIQHEGILPAKAYTEHEWGPALVFDHHVSAQRLDHYLIDRGAGLDVDDRLHLLRQIAEAVQYAHTKRLIHRALSPQSILVLNPEAPLPRIQIFNWQTAAREVVETRTVGYGTLGTSHLEPLVEEAAWVYMAPEAATEGGMAAEQLDVFSLGAIAYHLFSGQPPAASRYEMTERLRAEKGLQISSVLDGAWAALQHLIQHATRPEVTARTASAAAFLEGLEGLEDEITQPEERPLPDPLEARAGEELEHGLVVKKRLGRGSTALALLVERGGRELVLKVALSTENNDRLQGEGVVLGRLRHQHIVELHDVLHFKDRVGLLMAKAGDATLADRLREEGRLHLELLERFGEDLLTTVDWLEQKGIPHRDIKPENLGTMKLGDRLHLVLFDFSLTGIPAEKIRAGTRHYLDPFLQLRRPQRWDTYAERFAAAVTLYQMATGSLPRWGDGLSEPSVLDCEATVDADAFEPAIREGMTAFFAKALRRDYRQRFDNAQEMLRAWRQLFLDAARPEVGTDHGEGEGPVTSLDEARPDTLLSTLHLSARGLSAVERMNVRTVEDLLRFPLVQMHRMRGVGSQTRRELTELTKQLALRFPEIARAPKLAPSREAEEIPEEAAHASVDELLRQVLPAGRATRAKRDAEVLAVTLGLRDAAEGSPDAPGAADAPDVPDAPDAPVWPSQSDVARILAMTPVAVSQTLARARRRWAKTPALTKLRNDIVELLEAHGGVMTRQEVADALLVRRGSVQEQPLRSRHARACVRAAVETERSGAAPRWIVRRLYPQSPAERVLLARDELDERGAPRSDGQKLADYAERLGQKADELAAADPLLPPARVLEALQAIPLPAGVVKPAASRLLPLAAATSRGAALSSRLELYPRGMEPPRALKLGLGALAGARTLTPDEMRARISGRYPEAGGLPQRPALDSLLADAGSGMRWNPDAAEGRGAYESPLREFVTVPSPTSSGRDTAWGRGRAASPAVEDLALEAFVRRLQRALESQAFLALIASPRHLLEAERALRSAFPLDVLSGDELLIRHMKEAALEAGADWEVILRADRSAQAGGDWKKLMQLVAYRTLPRVRAELAAASRTVLLTELGLLARYDQMAFLDGLRDAAGRAGGPPGIWLLVPGDAQEARPVLDGKPVPVFTPGQWARIPRAWLAAQRGRGGTGPGPGAGAGAT